MIISFLFKADWFACYPDNEGVCKILNSSTTIATNNSDWVVQELNSQLQTWIGLWVSSPGRSGGRAGKGRRACNYRYVSGICRNVDAKCWLVQMTLVTTSLPLAHSFLCCFFLHSRSFIFALIDGNLTGRKYISTNLPNHISVWLGYGVKKSEIKIDVTSTIKENTTSHENEKDWTWLLPVLSFPLWHCEVGYTDIGQVSVPQFGAV